jgi:hypothetical protein
MAVMRAPPLNADVFRDAIVKLWKVVVHLRVPIPNDPLQMTMKDYAFKISILAGVLERGVRDPFDDDGGDYGSPEGSGSGSDSFRWRDLDSPRGC